MRCCAGDEGFVALRSRPAEGGFKPPHAALAEDRRGVVNMNAEDKPGLVRARCVGCGAVRRDGGCLALRSRPAGDGFKPPASALAEDRCGERRGERRDVIASGVDREDELSINDAARRRDTGTDIVAGKTPAGGLAAGEREPGCA